MSAADGAVEQVTTRRAARRRLEADEPERLVRAGHDDDARAGVRARELARGRRRTGASARGRRCPAARRSRRSALLERAAPDEPQLPRLARARGGVQQLDDALLARRGARRRARGRSRAHVGLRARTPDRRPKRSGIVRVAAAVRARVDGGHDGVGVAVGVVHPARAAAGARARSGPGSPAASSAIEPWWTATTRAPSSCAVARRRRAVAQNGSCSSDDVGPQLAQRRPSARRRRSAAGSRWSPPGAATAARGGPPVVALAAARARSRGARSPAVAAPTPPWRRGTCGCRRCARRRRARRRRRAGAAPRRRAGPRAAVRPRVASPRLPRVLCARRTSIGGRASAPARCVVGRRRS